MNLSPTNLNEKCGKYGENSIYALRYGIYCTGFHKTHNDQEHHMKIFYTNFHRKQIKNMEYG